VPARVATGAARHRELDRDASFRLHARRKLPDRTTPVSSLPAPEEAILAVIVGVVTGVLLMESYGAMVEAARGGGRAVPQLLPLGTEALALAMGVSVLEAKRLHHRAVLRLSWLLLVASVALSTLFQVAVAPPTLVGYLTAGATPVWLLGSFAVLSLLYRTPAPASRLGASSRRPAPPPAHRPARPAPAAATQRQRPTPHRRQRRRPGAHPAHHRRLVAQGAATSFPHKAAACREKAEALRVKYGL
jgi:hypothetical protein